jgi:hypothetical protein
MRRVSIGLELIARPDVLILDEPTSGMFIHLRMVSYISNGAFPRPGLCLRVPGCANPSLHRSRSGQSYTGHYFHPSTKVCPSPYIYYLSVLTTTQIFAVRNYINPLTQYSSFPMVVRSIQVQGYSHHQTTLPPLLQGSFLHTHKDIMLQTIYWRSQAIHMYPYSSSHNSGTVTIDLRMYRRKVIART